MLLRLDMVILALVGASLATLVAACGSNGSPSAAAALPTGNGASGTASQNSTPTGTPTPTPLSGVAGGQAPTLAPTPTKVIGGIEVTPTAPPARPTATSSAAAIAGLKISGTSTMHDDESISGGSGFLNNSDDLMATFTAHSTPASPTALVGTAHITFVKNYEQGGGSCKVKFTGNAAWDAELKGEYHVQADGSILVSLSATPTNGPTYTDQSNCFTQQVPASWYGSGGTLVNGTFDSRTETPVQKGSSFSTTHMELVP